MFDSPVQSGMLPLYKISKTIIRKLVCCYPPLINVPHDALSCTDPNCNDEAHYSHLCKFYEDITNLLRDAAGAIPTKAHNSSSKHFVLGWNDLVSESHQAARDLESFLIWRSAGSHRHGPLFDIMKTKRAEFKRRKRLCEKMLKLSKLIDLLLN